MCGCWNYRELNEYSIVTGMAIDYTDDQYEISFLISNIQKDNKSNQSSKVVVLSGQGDSVYEAIKNIGLASSKELYIGHLSVIILSEDIARNGIWEALDFLLREPESRKNFYLVLAKDFSAKDILAIISPLDEFPSQNISKSIVLTSQLQAMVNKTSFNTAMSKLLTHGTELNMNSVTIVGDEEDGTKQENTEKSILDAYLKLDVIGLFKDDKLVSWADNEESIGINLIHGKIDEAYFQIPCDDGYIIVNTEKMTREITPSLVNNIPAVDIKEEFNLIVTDSTCYTNLTDPKNIELINHESEDIIKEIIKKSINLAKENKTDIFGFGNLFYTKYYNYYKNIEEEWNDKIFPNLNVNVDIKVHVTSTGTAQITKGGMTSYE